MRHRASELSNLNLRLVKIRFKLISKIIIIIENGLRGGPTERSRRNLTRSATAEAFFFYFWHLLRKGKLHAAFNKSDGKYLCPSKCYPGYDENDELKKNEMVRRIFAGPLL